MRQYERVLARILGGLQGRSVVDFGAGSGWIRGFPFGSYVGLDMHAPDEPWAMRWHFDEPLPPQLKGRFDAAVSLNAIHYAADPNRTLLRFLEALKPGGTLVLAAPWLYPPHDRAIDYWRISPRGLHRLTARHFEALSLYPIGTLLDLPLRVASRLVGGVSEPKIRKDSPAHPLPIRPANESEVPASFFGPLCTIVVGDGFRSPP
jgi:SAM-dependent methyltransferase